MNVLDLEFDSGDLGKRITVRQFFATLLRTLWIEGEGFSGKRPFRNSGWEFDLYAALIKAGFIDGTLDEDGCVAKCDTRAAHRFVLTEIIDKMVGSP
jgi:hypothetical protein